MYDSTAAGDIPSSAQMVAGYVDGLYAWSDADWARFGDRPRVRIAVFASTNNGHCLDVEQGASSPDQAPGWAQMRRANGVDPSVYMSDNTWSAVRQAFQAQGVAEPHYWVAKWDNVPSIPAGAVANQYANPALTGGHFDLSAVVDFWPGVDTPQPPPPPPPPPPPKEITVTLLRDTSDGAVYLVSGHLVAHVGSPTDYNNLLGSGLKSADVSHDFIVTVLAAAAAAQGAVSGNLNVSGSLAIK